MIQTTPSTFREKLESLLPPGDSDVGAFIDDIFSLERPALTGERDFAIGLAELLEQRRSPVSVDDALQIWTLIEVESSVLDTISRIRQDGISCYLASNQPQHRAEYMSETLGYSQLFDAEFYSCHLGCAKPSSSYFELVLDAIELEPERVLFLDDREANVAGAREVGIHASVFAIDQGSNNRRALREVLSRYGVRVP